MFKKGQSGNPSGRPKVLLPDGRSLTDLAKAHTETAVATLGEILIDEDAPHAARIAAANALLDRGWGRAVQIVDATVKADKASALSDHELEQHILNASRTGVAGKAKGSRIAH